MSDINAAALLRRIAIVNAIAVTARVSKLAPAATPISGGTSLLREPLTADQAGQLLRYVLASRLREQAGPYAPSVPKLTENAGSAIARDSSQVLARLHILMADSASALSRAFPGNGNPATLETARAMLWRALTQHFFSASSPIAADDDAPDTAGNQRRSAPEWSPFLWVTPPGANKTSGAKRKRHARREEQHAEEDPELPAGQQDHAVPGRDREPALLDIVDWLNRQRGDADYSGLVNGDGSTTRTGGLFDDNA